MNNSRSPSEQAKALLFSRREDGRPALFKNAAELALRLVSNNSSVFYAEKESAGYVAKKNNAVTYISKAVNLRQRPSMTFMRSLSAVINEAAEDNKEGELILKNLEILFSQNRKCMPLTDRHIVYRTVFEEVIETMQKPKLQTMFGIPFMECSSTKPVEIFMDCILRNLTCEEQVTSYEFFFSEPIVALHFYRKLFYGAMYKLNMSEEEVVALFEKYNEKILNIYIVHDFFCTFPTIVFNHSSRDSSGFVVFVDSDRNACSGKMSEIELENWYTQFYLKALFTKSEISFKKCFKATNGFKTLS